MATKQKDVLSAYEKRLEVCGDDPRVLAAIAMMGRLSEVDAAAGLRPTYQSRLEVCGDDPRVLAAIAMMGQLSKVDAAAGLS